MGYCSVDIGKRDYPYDVRYRTDKKSAKLLACCDRLARKFPHLVLDRFGILDDNVFCNRLPRYVSDGIIDAGICRVHTLKEKTVCWSGGIDSTFIVACYLYSRIPFQVAYNSAGTDSLQGKIIFEELKKRRVPLIEMKLLSDYADFDDAVTGDAADLLFSPELKDLTADSPVVNGLRLPLYKALPYIYGIEGEKLYFDLLSYASKLGVSGKNEKDLVRALRFGSFYYFKRDYFRAVTGSDPKNMISFYDTEKFMDIAWSKFRNSVYENDKKIERRKFISKVLGNKELFYAMERNPSSYLRPSNLNNIFLYNIDRY